MADRIRHRGPDDEGYLLVTPDGTALSYRGHETVESLTHLPLLDEAPETFVGIGMGHRRLAIVDPTPGGHQPLSSPDGRLHLIYNGEIYNHEALRRELAREWTFRTTCDTEVLLAALATWGIDHALTRLEGMWAFALFDGVARRLFLVRDRFGEKPLFYAPAGEGLAFASEIKALLVLPAVPSLVNETAILQHLVASLSDEGEATPFAGIRRLPPASILEVPLENGRRNERRYWSIRDEVRPTAQCDARAIGEALEESVALRLRADVPVGTSLSGGLDSSAVAATAARLSGSKRFHAFTAVFPRGGRTPADADADAIYAREVVRFARLVHIEVPLRPEDLEREIVPLLWHEEVPTPHFHHLALRAVARSAADRGVRVLLDGQGGDELWAGYYGYVPPFLREVAKHRGAQAARDALARLQTAHPDLDVAEVELEMGWRRPTWSARLRRRLLPPRRPPHVRRSFYHELKGTLPPPRPRAETLCEARLRDLEGGPFLRYLRAEDRHTMAFSVEARLPLLDRTIFQLALSFPAERLIDGRMKSLWRKALGERVPRAVRDRPDKLGHGVLTDRWTDAAARLAREWLGKEARCARFVDARGVLDAPAEAMRAGRLARLLTLEAWMKAFDLR